MTAAASPSPTRPPSGEPTGGTEETSEEPDLADREDNTSIRVATEGTTVVIAVARCLDVPTGEALLSAANAAVATGSPTRLDIDLRALENFTLEGATALESCRALGAQLSEGLHYRTGRGPGRDALLAAYTTAEFEAIDPDND